jgi:penicillin-binding protein A
LPDQASHAAAPGLAAPAPSRARLTPERRQRLLRHGLPALLAIGAIVAVAVALVARSLGESPAEQAAARFAAAWERADYAAMHAALAPQARERVPAAELARAYDDARVTSTATRVDAGQPSERDGTVVLPVTVRTAVFGAIEGELRLPVEDESIGWAPVHSFPGLREGETLRRRSVAPERARILTRDGEPIAAGPAGARTSPMGPAGAAIAGELAPPAGDAERRSLAARGFPPETPVGRSGLELIAEREVAGTPGGTLLAGDRPLATAEPRPARDVRTTIDADVQRAAVAALAGRFGGVAALDAATGEVRALAGIAFSGPQPPGSTFKIVTAAAALEAGIVRPRTRFPVESATTIDDVELKNTNRESCGGTFVASFAHSCNTVFAPLGVRLGAERLVAMAERFGFNEPQAIAGAATSTIPAAGDIRSEVELGASAIGQGRLLATPLQLASIAQTVAAGGVRHLPRLLPDAPARRVRVIEPRTARQLERMMLAVVANGTGTAASLGRVRVAGKTGTAELEDTSDDEETGEIEVDPGSDTDAWFAAYAPARRSRIAVAVLLVRAGAGGATAAPAARTVLEAGIR